MSHLSHLSKRSMQCFAQAQKTRGSSITKCPILPGPEGTPNTTSTIGLGLPFLGIGPGAHGFDGQQRLANVSNNPRYIAAVQKAQRLDDLPVERDVLSAHDRYNEGLMTGLRTAKGIDVEALENEYGHHPQTEDPRFLEAVHCRPHARTAWRQSLPNSRRKMARSRPNRVSFFRCRVRLFFEPCA